MKPNPEDFSSTVSCRRSPLLETDRARTEVDYQHAKREVERLHLIVRLVGASEGRQG
jgi:hypothetical protein